MGARGLVLVNLLTHGLHMRRSHGEVGCGNWRLLWLEPRSFGNRCFHEPRSFFWLLGAPAAEDGGRTEEPRNEGVVPPPAGVEEATAVVGV